MAKLKIIKGGAMREFASQENQRKKELNEEARSMADSGGRQDVSSIGDNGPETISPSPFLLPSTSTAPDKSSPLHRPLLTPCGKVKKRQRKKKKKKIKRNKNEDDRDDEDDDDDDEEEEDDEKDDSDSEEESLLMNLNNVEDEEDEIKRELSSFLSPSDINRSIRLLRCMETAGFKLNSKRELIRHKTKYMHIILFFYFLFGGERKENQCARMFSKTKIALHELGIQVNDKCRYVFEEKKKCIYQKTKLNASFLKRLS